MCGIVGAVAQRDITPILVEGLKRLEYRGYDSCGVAVCADGHLRRTRSTQRVAELSDQIAQDHVTGFTGIAHTRWATHGVPATHNAHPHFSHLGNDEPRIALVHNGIIENHDELRAELQAAGYVFESQTDTGVIAHLVNHLYAGDLFEAVQQAVRRLHGAYAIAVFCRDEPHRVVGARQGSPLVVAWARTRTSWRPMRWPGWHHRPDHLPGRRRRRRPAADPRLDRGRRRPRRRSRRAPCTCTGAAELGPYRHYMQKEIFEQPRAVGDTLQDIESVTPELFGDDAYKIFKDIDSVLVPFAAPAITPA